MKKFEYVDINGEPKWIEFPSDISCALITGANAVVVTWQAIYYIKNYQEDNHTLQLLQ